VAVLVIVLIVTNLVALGALVRARRAPAPTRDPEGDAMLTALTALTASPGPPGAAGGSRRLISIEILNPIELAASRGRVLGIAGSFAPGVTRRIVYDQTVKILKRQLVERAVVADVRVHALRPPRPVPLLAPPVPPAPPHVSDPPAPYLIERVELGEDQPPV